MSDQLERFHAALALQSTAVGLLIATIAVWVTARSARRPSHQVAGHHVVMAVAGAISALGVRDYISAGSTVALLVLVAVAGADRRPDTPIVGVLVTVSLIGVWAAVPDTEAPLIAAAIVTTVVTIIAVTQRTSLQFRGRRGDRLPAIALVVVVALVGSAGRSEVIGGIGCVGLLVGAVIPAPQRLRRHEIRPGVIIGLHVMLVCVSSRLLTRCSTAMAIVGVAVIATVSLVVGSFGIGALPTVDGAD